MKNVAMAIHKRNNLTDIILNVYDKVRDCYIQGKVYKFETERKNGMLDLFVDINQELIAHHTHPHLAFVAWDMLRQKCSPFREHAELDVKLLQDRIPTVTCTWRDFKTLTFEISPWWYTCLYTCIKGLFPSVRVNKKIFTISTQHTDKFQEIFGWIQYTETQKKEIQTELSARLLPELAPICMSYLNP